MGLGWLWTVTTAWAVSGGHTGGATSDADTDADTDSDTDADTDTDSLPAPHSGLDTGSIVTCPDCQGVAGQVGEEGGAPCDQGCSTVGGSPAFLGVAALFALRRPRSTRA